MFSYCNHMDQKVHAFFLKIQDGHQYGCQGHITIIMFENYIFGKYTLLLTSCENLIEIYL